MTWRMSADVGRTRPHSVWQPWSARVAACQRRIVGVLAILSSGMGRLCIGDLGPLGDFADPQTLSALTPDSLSGSLLAGEHVHGVERVERGRPWSSPAGSHLVGLARPVMRCRCKSHAITSRAAGVWSSHQAPALRCTPVCAGIFLRDLIWPVAACQYG